MPQPQKGEAGGQVSPFSPRGGEAPPDRRPPRPAPQNALPLQLLRPQLPVLWKRREHRCHNTLWDSSAGPGVCGWTAKCFSRQTVDQERTGRKPSFLRTKLMSTHTWMPGRIRRPRQKRHFLVHFPFPPWKACTKSTKWWILYLFFVKAYSLTNKFAGLWYVWLQTWLLLCHGHTELVTTGNIVLQERESRERTCLGFVKAFTPNKRYFLTSTGRFHVTKK